MVRLDPYAKPKTVRHRMSCVLIAQVATFKNPLQGESHDSPWVMPVINEAEAKVFTAFWTFSRRSGEPPIRLV